MIFREFDIYIDDYIQVCRERYCHGVLGSPNFFISNLVKKKKKNILGNRNMLWCEGPPIFLLGCWDPQKKCISNLLKKTKYFGRQKHVMV
ncbi:hypothetical protein XELAEV_18003829mg [Xenopus laevis]|uniref:Uncharacterized protein n=1 Tax=Xenopus laevis TaxID=8355 RepID=A0A974BNL1_XENLA|nr:hypothetical protein XELAEV_18003829mg [Xenopus laevis]